MSELTLQQKTQPKRPIRKTRDDDVSMTRRQEVQQRLRPVSGKRTTANGDLRNQRQKDYMGRYGHLEEPMYEDDFTEDFDHYPNGQWQCDGHHSQPHYDLQGTNTRRYSTGIRDKSLVKGPEEEPGPKWRPGWNIGLYWAAFMVLCVFLVSLVSLRLCMWLVLHFSFHPTRRGLSGPMTLWSWVLIIWHDRLNVGSWAVDNGEDFLGFLHCHFHSNGLKYKKINQVHHIYFFK